MSDEVTTAVEVIGSAVVLLGLAAFISMWAHRAEGNRALTVGLYLVFGAFGLFAFLFGLGSIFRDYREGDDPGVGSIFWLVVGIVAGLSLLPPLRHALARILPFDPNSYADMTGLFILGVIATAAAFQLFVEPEDQEPVTYFVLVVTAITEVALAFIVVGIWFYRSSDQARKRLGLVVPSMGQVGIALALVIAAFIVSGLSSYLVQVLQPDLYDEITDNLRTLTSEVDSVWGALLLGLAAGIGEEILFRGAIQPRYGIVFTAFVFALLHQQYGASFVTLGVFGIGLLFGLERKYLNTTSCIITHTVYNALAVIASQYAETADESTAQFAAHCLALLAGIPF